MFNQADYYWIWFSSFPFLKLRTRVDLLAEFNGPEGIFHAEASDLKRIRGISSDIADIIRGTRLDKADRIIDECEKQAVSIITLTDNKYPFRLKNIYSPPSVLYTKGVLSDIDDSAVISVIGTRKASQYGIRMGKKIAYEIEQCGGLIVSLLTTGVDAAAAEGALLSDRPCIGVLGTSHEYDHNPLTERMSTQGAVISEYPPGTVQMRTFFRDRNRIAAGISLGTVVVEAPVKSGTRYFVNEALDQGKDIFAVPGNADSENSMGTLDLLKMGAKPVGSGWDVLSEYSGLYTGLHCASSFIPDEQIRSESGDTVVGAVPDVISEPVSGSDLEAEWKRKIDSLNEDQIRLFSLIEQGYSLIGELIEEGGLSAPKTLSVLTILEIKGLIIRDLSGNIFINKHFERN